MGAFHIRNYAQLDCAELVAVADPDAAARSRALAGAQALEFSDWRDLVEDGDELAAIEADRKLMVGHVERFNPAVEKLRDLVADGRLGRVYRAHTTRVGPLPTR